MSSLGNLARSISYGNQQRSVYDTQNQQRATNELARAEAIQKSEREKFLAEQAVGDIEAFQSNRPTQQSLGLSRVKPPAVTVKPPAVTVEGIETQSKLGDTQKIEADIVKDPGVMTKVGDWITENPLDAAATAAMFVPGVGWVASAVLRSFSAGGKLYGVYKKGKQVVKAADELSKRATVATRRGLGRTRREYGDPGAFGRRRTIPANRRNFDTEAAAQRSLNASNYRAGSQEVIQTANGKWTIAPTVKNVLTSSKTAAVGGAVYLGSSALSDDEKKAKVNEHKKDPSGDIPSPAGEPTERMWKNAAGIEMTETEATKVLSTATKAWNARKLAAVRRLQEGGILGKDSLSNFIETGTLSMSAKDLASKVKSKSDIMKGVSSTLDMVVPGLEDYYGGARGYFTKSAKGVKKFDTDKAKSDIYNTLSQSPAAIAVVFGRRSMDEMTPADFALAGKIIGKNRSADFQGSQSSWYDPMSEDRAANLSTGNMLISKFLAKFSESQSTIALLTKDGSKKQFDVALLREEADNAGITLDKLIARIIGEKDTSEPMKPQ